MSPTVKLLILVAVALGEGLAMLVLFRSRRSSPALLAVFAGSAVISVLVTAYVLFLVVD